MPALLAVTPLRDGGAAAAGAAPVLERLDLVQADAAFGVRLGTALAALHRLPCPLDLSRFGWRRDNWLGATPQTNTPCAVRERPDWPAVYAQRHLRALQEHLCPRFSGTALCGDIDAVIAALPRSFEDGHTPRPSLVHGDLWSGNRAMLVDGTPVFYDPAVSCCDAEAELAMMGLFGAPPDGFWPAYRAGFALHAGCARRRPLYQLYHLLNHVLLFGAGNVAVAHACAARVLRATR